jgi:hypothetical protein
LRRKPDTNQVIRQVITQTIERRPAWWEKPLYFITGAAVGYFINSFNRKRS